MQSCRFSKKNIGMPGKSESFDNLEKSKYFCFTFFSSYSRQF